MSFLKFFKGTKASKAEAEAEVARRSRFDAKISAARAKLRKKQEAFLSAELECSKATGCASCKHYDEGAVFYHYDPKPTAFADWSRIWTTSPDCKFWRLEK